MSIIELILKPFYYLKRLITVDNSIKNIIISVSTRYISFLGGLLVTTIIPHTLRGVYLWGGTLNACIMCYLNNQLSLHLLLISIGGLLHSSCHLYWPFLVETINGFDQSVSAFPDVLFHTIMLIFIWISIRKTLSKNIDILTMFFIGGSAINCMLTNYNSSVNYKNEAQYLLFNILKKINNQDHRKQ